MTPARREQRILWSSAFATLLLGLLGIAAGLWIGSGAIMFDGFYSLVDLSMTLISLLVARLVAVGVSRRFQFGFWHLEPMLVAFNSTILLLACAYAFLDGLSTFLDGGRTVAFGTGAAYAAISGVGGLLLAFYERRASRDLNSPLIELDIRAYVLGGMLSLGLFGSFLVGFVLTRYGAAHLSPYVDPVVLMLLSAILSLLPLKAIIIAMKEIFQLAPRGLDTAVRTVMDRLVVEAGFRSYKAHVAQAGRIEFIEIDVVVARDFPVTSVADLDHYRQRIADGLGQSGATRWLTISFTCDERWI